MSKKSNLLLDDGELITVQTKLAVLIGDRQAIALQQIHYWMGLNQKTDKREYLRDGIWWTRNTWAAWKKKNFPYWSVSTIRRVFSDLEADGLIITQPSDNHNKGLWVTVNYGRLEQKLKQRGEQKRVRRVGSAQNEQAKENVGSVQNEQGSLSKLNRLPAQNEQPVPTENIETIRESISAPIGAGTVKSDDGAPQDKQLARALFAAVAKHIYGIDGQEVNGAGGRIGKISNWLAGKYAGRGENKIGKISHPASPDHVARFAAWYKSEHPGVTIPRDFVKFVESWREWATAQRKPQPVAIRFTQEELDEMTREMNREKFGIDQ